MTKESLDLILKDSSPKPELVKSLADPDTAYQMGNPVRVLTSGEEAPASDIIVRLAESGEVARQKWWDRYVDETPVVIGHYWRHFDELSRSFGKKAGPDLFGESNPTTGWARATMYIVLISRWGSDIRRKQRTSLGILDYLRH